MSAFEELYLQDYSDSLILDDYDKTVIQGKTHAIYARIIQTGKKAGESLFHHVLNGVLLLETLRPLLGLTDDEARVLYLAFTIHDLNKVSPDRKAFNQIATPDNVREEIKRLELEAFLPQWERYLQDITTLVRGHGAHSDVAGERLIPAFGARYGLGQERINALVYLMRAADVIGLSPSLEERKHKVDFISHLNQYLTASHRPEQYELHLHRIVEQRGLLTNLMHNTLIEAFQTEHGWLPIVLYSDGVMYIAPRGAQPIDGASLPQRLGERVSRQIQSLTGCDPATLIEQTAQGIKFRPDALTAGHGFSTLFAQAHNLISRRKFNLETLEAKARERLEAHLATLSQHDPIAAQSVSEVANQRNLILATDAQMRSAELARTYFIFLNDYAPQVMNPWAHIYPLLNLPADRHSYFNAFDARYDRPYVLAGDVLLTEDEVYERLAADGEQMWQQLIIQASANDESILWMDYVRRYVVIDQQALDAGGTGWADHLAHYIENQHQQCIHCTSPFPTQLWRSADVRDGIEVQKFSNRLAAGGNREPVKHVCRVCRTQFMLESLNYPAVKGENLFYLHLFPRSFQTQPFVKALVRGFQRARDGFSESLKALHLNPEAVLEQMRRAEPLRPGFANLTKQGKPHTYGIYAPQFSHSIAGLLVLPLNAPGDNDSERYLFALWYALILGRYLDARVILTKDPTPPFSADDLPELFLDLAPLGSAGLLRYSAYDTEAGDDRGSIDNLWEAVDHLFALRRLLSPAEDKLPDLVRALSSGPLHLFHRADRILEVNDRDFFAHDAQPHLERLAIIIGGEPMEKLSESLKQLAAHAWANGLRGSSLKRSSLLYPVTTMLNLLAQRPEHDREFLIAVTVQEIFEHLERIQDGDFRIGRGKRHAIEQFVRDWHKLILHQAYRGSVQRMITDQKLLTSAYLFYIQAEIPHKTQDEKESA